MTEEKENVVAPLQQEENVQPPQDSQSLESEKSTDSKPEESVSDKEINFKRLRDKNKQLEEELSLIKRKQEEIYNSQQNSSEEELAPDDIPEWKHVEKRFKKLENYIKQKETATIPDRLNSKFNDFEKVVSEGNVELLKKQEPELFVSITSNQDLYQKGVAAYKAIKALKIYKDDLYKEEKKHVQQSSSRPMSAQSIQGQGAIHDANLFAKGLTPELKKQLYKEMTDCSKAS